MPGPSLLAGTTWSWYWVVPAGFDHSRVGPRVEIDAPSGGLTVWGGSESDASALGLHALAARSMPASVSSVAAHMMRPCNFIRVLLNAVVTASHPIQRGRNRACQAMF